MSTVCSCLYFPCIFKGMALCLLNLFIYIKVVILFLFFSNSLGQ